MRYSRLRADLRRARLEQSLSQAALAARSGTSRVTIARLETGSARDVRVGTISRISAALGLEVAAVPTGAEAVLERLLTRERESSRREASALVRKARAVVDRWERERLCSRHYISRWRAMLAGPVDRVARSLLEPGDWRDALFQNTPWTFALERPRP